MKNALLIKQAASGDIKTLAAIAREIWTQHYTPIIGIGQVNYMLEKFQSEEAIKKDIAGGYVYNIAFIDGLPCGYSAVRLDKDGLFLSKIYVKKDCRGKGVGRALLERITEYAKQNNALRIWLTCNKYNTDSLKTYQRLGFKQINECVTDIGGGYVMDDYILEKPLG